MDLSQDERVSGFGFWFAVDVYATVYCPTVLGDERRAEGHGFRCRVQGSALALAASSDAEAAS